MTALIDGNNLLFAARDAEALGPDPGRAALCRWLGRWAEATQRRVVVVFDGAAPAPGLAAQIGDARIETVFSGRGVPADDVLVRRIGGDTAPRRLTVVSSDRAVANAARRRRATAVGSADFWRQLRRDLASTRSTEATEPPEKQQGQSAEQTEAWLDEFGLRGKH